MYEARIQLENGLAASSKFEDYAAMCRWLAANAEAGIEAYDVDAGAPVDQQQLQADVAAYRP
jgi:hypothetical protein